MADEDEGMMGVTQITGTEGSLYTGAESIDSTCYRGAAVASPTSASTGLQTVHPLTHDAHTMRTRCAYDEYTMCTPYQARTRVY